MYKIYSSTFYDKKERFRDIEKKKQDKYADKYERKIKNKVIG